MDETNQNIKPEKGSKLKSKSYKAFLNGDFINTLNIDTISLALDNINIKEKKHKEEARALLILLYYTGCRPSEALNLKSEDVYKEGNELYIMLKTLKHGQNRKIAISSKRKHITELWGYVQKVFPTLYLFEHFRSTATKTIMSRDKIDKKTMQKVEGKLVKYDELSAKLRYHFYKWFEGIIEDTIPPYYLRHNRFSKMSEKGATVEDIMKFKGSKSESSVMPYIHMSKSGAKKLSRFID